MRTSFKRILSVVLALCVLLASATCLMSMTASADTAVAVADPYIGDTVVYTWTNPTQYATWQPQGSGLVNYNTVAGESTQRITFDYYNPIAGSSFNVQNYSGTGCTGYKSFGAGRGSMDVTITASKTGDFAVGIQSNKAHTGTLYIWNVKVWSNNDEKSVTSFYSKSGVVGTTTYDEIPFPAYKWATPAQWNTWTAKEAAGNLPTLGSTVAGTTNARISFEYLVAANGIAGQSEGDFVVMTNGGSSPTSVIHESTSGSNKLVIGYPGKIDITFTAGKNGAALQPAIQSNKANNYSLYLWNVKIWLNGNEFSVSTMDKGDVVTVQDIPTIYKNQRDSTNGGDPYVYSPELIALGVMDAEGKLARDGRLIRVTFEYLSSERVNLLYKWYLAAGRGSADITGNMQTADTKGYLIYIASNATIWDVNLWYDYNKDGKLTDDEKFDACLRVSHKAGTHKFSMLSDKQFETENGYSPDDELVAVIDTSGHTGSQYPQAGFGGFQSGNAGAAYNVSFKYFVTGDSSVGLVGIGGNSSISEKSSASLQNGVVAEYSCKYTLKSGQQSFFLGFQVDGVNTAGEATMGMPAKVYFWDVKIQKVDSAESISATVDALTNKYATSGFQVLTEEYSEDLFNTNAADVDGRVGDANWNGEVDVLDLVYANTKLSDAGVKIKDYRAVNFNGKDGLDAEDLVGIRGKIFEIF